MKVDETLFDKYVKQIDLESWSEFKSKIDSFMLEWIYRGQANSLWGLSSSLERSSLLEIDVNIELALIAEYKNAIRTFHDLNEIPKSTLEWLSLLQHHGTPTRLVDFTESPYIAAFFAFQDEESEKSDSVAIWCVNRIRFYQAALYYFDDKLESSNGRNPYLFNETHFEKLFEQSIKGREINCVMPYEIVNANQRQYMQQSVFLAAMNPDERLVDQLSFLDYQEKPIMTKLTIPSNERKVALRDLLKMNISHATLFPGIDGFSRALNLTYSTLATVWETGKWVQKLKNDGCII